MELGLDWCATLGQLRAGLRAAALLVNAPSEILPFLAIGLFAGLRRAELKKQMLISPVST